MPLHSKFVQKFAIGIASLALIAPLGLSTGNVVSNPTNVSASRVSRRRHRRRSRRSRRATSYQKFEVALMNREARILQRSVRSRRLHISKHHRRSLKREANRISRQARTLEKEVQDR